MGLRFPILFNLSILSSLLLSALHLKREWLAIPMDPLFFPNWFFLMGSSSKKPMGVSVGCQDLCLGG